MNLSEIVKNSTMDKVTDKRRNQLFNIKQKSNDGKRC